MTAESQWDSTRWRSHTPRFEGMQQHPQLSGTQTSQAGLKDPPAQSWYGASHGHAQQYSYNSRRPSQTYNTQLSQYAQPDGHAPCGNYFPSDSTPVSNGLVHTGTWRSDPSQDTSTADKRGVEAPLSLQIPNKAADLPSLAHGYATPRSDAPMYSSGTSSWSHHTTSLPSFAALSEQATRAEEPDEVEIAPMSARLTCTQCTKLGPLMRELAIAVTELDCDIASLCSAAGPKSPDVPGESTMRTVKWILDRVRYMKRDTQDLVRQGAADRSRHQPQASTQYSNSLKRTAEQWDQDEMPTLKLPRPNASHPDASSDTRRTSIDFATRDSVQRLAYSPAPSESAPGSAYPRHGSPVSGRLPRALPSPSSLAFPPSGPASFVPANAASIGSPGTSYHPGSSIHTVSTNSATSAHLQDLQHQVSLKSLALQTLQTEYATLLQKLQRERIKSQTIEKKTTVADQEVNDLTTRNEELMEQIRTLETQLQDVERKRDSEREDAAKEKEQWGRMLDMSGRLQNKSASDCQRLAKEKADLLQRLAAFEANGAPLVHQSTSNAGPTHYLPASHRSLPPTTGDEKDSARGRHSATTTSTDLESLRKENTQLQAKVGALQSSLEELRRHYDSVEETIEHLVTRKALLRRTINEASAKEDLVRNEGPAEIVTHDRDPAAKPTPSNAAVDRRPDDVSPAIIGALRPQSTISASDKRGHDQGQLADPLSRENLAHIARAVSPGPAELGFHVQPSTSSPEELIKALGPVPAPLPSMRFSSSLFEDSTLSHSATSKQRRRQSQPFIAPLSVPPNSDEGFPRMPSFRPLDQHITPQEAFQRPGASPRSHHSSPGPNLSNSSSPGSTSTRSPEYRNAGRGEYDSTRRHSQPQMATSPSTAAMPPPPRPLP